MSDEDERFTLDDSAEAFVGHDKDFTGSDVPVERHDSFTTGQAVVLGEVPSAYQAAHACHTAPHRPQKYSPP